MEPHPLNNHYLTCLEMIQENHPWLRDAVTSATSSGNQSQPEACEIEEQPLIIRRYAPVPRTTPDVPYTDEVLAEHEKTYGKWSHRAPPTTSTAKLTNTEKTEEELESLASVETFPWRPHCHAQTIAEQEKDPVKAPPNTSASRPVDDGMRPTDKRTSSSKGITPVVTSTLANEAHPRHIPAQIKDVPGAALEASLNPRQKDTRGGLVTEHFEEARHAVARSKIAEGLSANTKGLGPDEDFWSDDEGLVDSRADAEKIAGLQAARKSQIISDNEEENERWRKAVRGFRAREVHADRIAQLKLARLDMQGLAPAMPLDRPTVLGLYNMSQRRTTSKTSSKLRGLSWTRRSQRDWDKIHERRPSPVRRSSGINEKLDAGSVEQTYIANQSEDDNDLPLSLE